MFYAYTCPVCGHHDSEHSERRDYSKLCPNCSKKRNRVMVCDDDPREWFRVVVPFGTHQRTFQVHAESKSDALALVKARCEFWLFPALLAAAEWKRATVN